MHFAAVQFDIAWEDKPSNHRQMETMLDDALIPEHAFALLPELGDTGFSFNLQTIVDDQTSTWASAQAQSRRAWIQAGEAQLGDDGKGRNRATLYHPDGSTGLTYEKVHPFSYGKEVEHFSGGEHLALTRVGDGDDSFVVCPLICYDLRFPELWRLATLAGAEVFTIGASWPAARQHHWRTLLIARAIENQAFVVACNRTGNDPHLPYAGGSMIISPDGTILAEADDAPAVISADLDRGELERWRAKFPAIRDIHADLLGSVPIQLGDDGAPKS